MSTPAAKRVGIIGAGRIGQATARIATVQQAATSDIVVPWPCATDDDLP